MNEIEILFFVHLVIFAVGLCYIHKRPTSSDKRKFDSGSWTELNEVMKRINGKDV